VVAVIMLIIGSNIARAFTLVGALSIIRFRNAVKETRDVGFIFFAMAIGMATLMVLIRRYPREPMVLAAVISGILTGALSALMTDPLVISARDLSILAGFGITFAAAHIMMTEGARLIPAARTGLVGTLETPLAPVWAWMILSELPPLTTWIGGAIVLAAVVWNLLRER
jgi:drug/metabolite transporter (DMT)-like permease